MNYYLSFLAKYVPVCVWSPDKTDETPASESEASPAEALTKPTEPSSVSFVSAPEGEATEIEGSGPPLVLEVAPDDRHPGRRARRWSCLACRPGMICRPCAEMALGGWFASHSCRLPPGTVPVRRAPPGGDGAG